MKPPTVRQNKERCMIRWNYQGKDYSLTWGKWKNSTDRAKLDLCGKMVYQDCLADNFDASLNKYRSWLAGIAPTASYSVRGENISSQPTLLALLEAKVEENYNSADDALLKLLKQYNAEIKLIDQAKEFFKWLKKRNLKATSLKRYLATLQHLRRDLFGDLIVKVEQKPRPKPFTKQEVAHILEALRTSTFYHYYHDWVLLLFNSGMRTSEAIGLRWCDVDMKEKVIHIYESLGRNKGSTSQRIRKSTKTANYRVIPMNERVYQMLCSRSSIKHKKEDLIFLSPKGKVIDEHNFTQRGWKFTLRDLGIERRPFYTTRATFASHCADAGLQLHEISALLGHSRITTTSDFYLGIVRRPTLPEL